MVHVLIGPRQVGKTTITRQIQESIGISSIYATADSLVPLDSAWIETQWRRAVAEEAASGGPEIRVLILGSSALLMQQGLTESLAGRFFLHRCTHWGYPA
ncbi:hypothetical protein [Geobacter metallireducens]|uniref:hypothetical protein n=1 Tax=Geobacter metallireducens TaxID=28232 RepID=UPI0002F1A674|nr:hypothetical protein [Geobacter metallireducens]